MSFLLTPPASLTIVRLLNYRLVVNLANHSVCVGVVEVARELRVV